MTDKTREEHLAWCKTRALEYLDNRDLTGAYASMISDMKKHKETARIALAMGPIGLQAMINDDARALRQWIDGFS